MRKGCQGYIAHVVDTRKDSASLCDIVVVRDYLDVFSEDIVGVPPEREVEVTIDLVPGAAPISNAP